MKKLGSGSMRLIMTLCFGLMVMTMFGSAESFVIGSGISFVGSELMKFVPMVGNVSFNALVWIDTNGKFKAMKSEDIAKLEAEQVYLYKDAEVAEYKRRFEELEKKGDNREELIAVKQKLEDIESEMAEIYKTTIRKMGEEINTLKTHKPGSTEAKSGLEAFKTLLGKAGNELAQLKSVGGRLELKADVGYADLTQTGQLDQLQTGISDIVKKTPVIWGLFKKIKMVSDTYTYFEQTSAVRNAQGVAVCAKNFTSLTKEEIGIVRTNYVKLKDSVDICRDYAQDFDFVFQRYRTLINDSMAFLIDTELLLGTDSATSTNSIDNVSSEFDGANVNAPIGATIQDAQMVDLILGMQAQIETLGKLGSFQPNVVLVNRMDWFKNVESLKDSQGNYLDSRVSRDGRFFRLNGMLIIPVVDVVANTLYMMDVDKGAILDRMQSELRISDENGTNFIDEFTTMMATAKLQFLVESNNANAFMKCSNITVAIGTITKP